MMNNMTQMPLFLQFGSIVNDAVVEKSKLAFQMENLVRTFEKFTLSDRAEKFHEEVTARWNNPMINGIASGPALIFAGAHLQVEEELARRSIIITPDTISKAAELGAQKVDKMLSKYPNYLAVLLENLNRRAVVDATFARRLRYSAEQLESYKPILKQITESFSKNVPVVADVCTVLAPRIFLQQEKPLTWQEKLWIILDILFLILLLIILL